LKLWISVVVYLYVGDVVQKRIGLDENYTNFRKEALPDTGVPYGVVVIENMLMLLPSKLELSISQDRDPQKSGG
jgi:hypothetical protein